MRYASHQEGEGFHPSLNTSDDEQAIDLPSVDISPDVQYESNEFEQIVFTEIEKLPLPYSPICTLFFVHNMSYDQIVDVTGLPLGTVKVRLFRGRALLRDAVTRRLGPARVGEAMVTQEG